MLHVTIIESARGFRPIVENRETRVAFAEPVFMDSYRDALRVAQDVIITNGLGNWRDAIIERKTRDKFPGIGAL